MYPVWMVKMRNFIDDNIKSNYKFLIIAKFNFMKEKEGKSLKSRLRHSTEKF